MTTTGRAPTAVTNGATMTDPDPLPEHWVTWIRGIATSCDMCGPDANLCPHCGERAGVLLYRDFISPGDEDWKCRACCDEWNTYHPQLVPRSHRMRARAHLAAVNARYRIEDRIKGGVPQ